MSQAGVSAGRRNPLFPLDRRLAVPGKSVSIADAVIERSDVQYHGLAAGRERQ
jgi:hypothetical protein